MGRPPLSGPIRGGRPIDYHAGEVRALVDGLDHFGIRRAVLFGHSDGGTIALLAAADAPDRVAACITEAAHVFVEAITLQGIRDARADYEAPGSRLRAGLARHHGEARVDRVFYGWADAWLSEPFAGWEMTDRLPGIHCPVLAIQGANDQYGTPEQVRAIVEGVSGPAEPLLIDGSGHSPHVDMEEIVVAASLRMLAGC
jgi:pimeloyl-ACP methyl ester carboxylesterase